MPVTAKIPGFYGIPNGKTLEGTVALTFSSRGLQEVLTVSFTGQYQISVSFRPVEQLVKSARQKVISAARPSSSSPSTLEETTTLDGYYSDRSVKLRPGPVNIWVRANRTLEMLTLSFGDLGQISLPYSAVAELVQRERRSLA